MRIAILETVKTSGGFEQEFDRIIIDELRKQGHEPVLYLPENSSLPIDFGIPIKYLSGGEIVNYEGAGCFKKWWLSWQREKRRVRWFNAAYEKAMRHEVDAILLTTATYRYLRSLHKSQLKNSPVPVIFIFLGVKPKEMPMFLSQAQKCLPYKNIKLKVTSLRDDLAKENLPNVEVIAPPVLLPEGVIPQTKLVYHEPVRIGFFGHYRKGEKDIEGIIQAFLACKLGKKAEFVIQAAPTEPEDKADIKRIMEKYAAAENVRFIEGKLFGKAWYDLLQSVDIFFLPYSDPRYLYNWSAVYFNALALYKPVLATKYLNPEILAHYQVGYEVDLTDLKQLSRQMSAFLRSYQALLPKYQQELDRVNRDFSADVFLKNLLR